MTGWIVIFVAVIAELAGGAVVANQTSEAIAITVLITPVVVVFGFAVVQWWQVTSTGAERAPWWHLAGVAAAIITWVIWPPSPGRSLPLRRSPARTTRGLFAMSCRALPYPTRIGARAEACDPGSAAAT
jgi:hypothetical protein